jgi:hypothetical protein
MPSLPKSQLPVFVRRCWNAWRKANVSIREEEKTRLGFYVGGELQWREGEITDRKRANRPFITVNKCKPAVDQIEGDVRLNPPGPQCKPVGENEDAPSPDIIEGLIREVEYRSMSEVADSTAVKYSAISGYGVIEMQTEYSNERDDQQRLVLKSVEDPGIVFFDPKARMANRQDARWAGKICQYSADEYEMAFGKRKVRQPGGVQQAQGWMADAMGIGSEDTQTLLEWTGARDDGDGRWRGPFYVCEFYMVEEEDRTSRLYDDKLWYFDGEKIPDGVKRVEGDGVTERKSPKRVIKKYLVDALEVLDETEWPGSLIPLFPVLGPEIYIDGKLFRLSLISPGMDSNRALNYVATTATEIAGLANKSGYVGYKGQFDDPRWQTANTEVWAYLEVTPAFATDEMGVQHLLPPPQKNQWEAPIQWLLALGSFFTEQFKAVTSMYSSSLGEEKGDQSGKAIEQLRSESNVGNFSYADNLHRTKTIIYQQMCVIFPKIMTGPQVVAIVRPDSQHEMVAINQVFGPDGIDPATGKKGKRNNLALGEFSVRVVAGPNFQTRQDQAMQMLLEAIKINPAILQNPAVTAKIIRMIGQGNPEMEGIADLISPSNDQEMTPQQMHQALQMAQQQSTQQQQTIQKLAQMIATKQPEIDAKERQNVRDNLTKLLSAKITASKDADRAQADREADQFMQMIDNAHQVGMAAMQNEHQQQMPAVTAAAQPAPETTGATQ